MFQKFFYNHLKMDIINKFNYPLFLKIPRLKKIILVFNTSNFNLLLLNLMLLKLTFNQKTNLIIKTKKGKLTGCRIFLKSNSIEYFLKTLLKKIQIFSISTTNLLVLCLHVYNFSLTTKLKNFYNVFTELNKLNIFFIFNNKKKQEIKYVIKNLKNLKSFNFFQNDEKAIILNLGFRFLRVQIPFLEFKNS